MSWSHEQKSAAWNKAKTVAGNDPNKWRKDACGAWIGWSFHGDRDSEYGWEVDHINPNGGDENHNLRALQWQNNVEKSDGRLACAVTAKDARNVAVAH
jgi:hypothetical protein